MIPDTNFFTALFNIDQSDIDSLATRTDEETVTYELTLKRKVLSCPYCGGHMIGHGHKLKKIDHPVLRNRKGVILYNANRYICKQCSRTVLEDNPFSMPGFNSSTFLLQNVMQKLRNLNYTLNMISEDLNISPTQLNNYIDSFITIPPRRLPESLGIDELHSKVLSKRSAAYLCILVDNQNRCLYDILDSRSKYALANHFSNIPRNERLGVKYVTIDMWEPYRDIARTYFPSAIVAVDPFHVIEHLVNDFEKLRISLPHCQVVNSYSGIKIPSSSGTAVQNKEGMCLLCNLAYEVIPDGDLLDLLTIHDPALSDDDLIDQSVKQYFIQLLNRSLALQFLDKRPDIGIVIICSLEGLIELLEAISGLFLLILKFLGYGDEALRSDDPFDPVLIESHDHLVDLIRPGNQGIIFAL